MATVYRHPVRHRTSAVLSVLLLLLGLLVAAGPAAAATATGGLLGSVDVQPGAQAMILVRNLDTGAMATAIPNKDGNYRLDQVPVGRYQVMLMVNGKSVGEETITVIRGFSVTVPELYPINEP